MFLLFSVSCFAQKLPDNFDYGKTEGHIYTNKYFNLAIDYPESWVLQNKEQVENLKEQGAELLTTKDETLKAVVKASEVNSATLLTVFKYEVGSAVDFNPSVMVVAENTKNSPGIKKGKDYLFHAKKFLQQSNLYTFEDALTSRKIGNKDFDVLHANLKYMDNIIKQEYITTVVNGFSLSFIVTYLTDEQKNELYRILDKVKI
jgi:hypothetical protein